MELGQSFRQARSKTNKYLELASQKVGFGISIIVRTNEISNNATKNILCSHSLVISHWVSSLCLRIYMPVQPFHLWNKQQHTTVHKTWIMITKLGNREREKKARNILFEFMQFCLVYGFFLSQLSRTVCHSHSISFESPLYGFTIA